MTTTVAKKAPKSTVVLCDLCETNPGTIVIEDADGGAVCAWCEDCNSRVTANTEAHLTSRGWVFNTTTHDHTHMAQTAAERAAFSQACSTCARVWTVDGGFVFDLLMAGKARADTPEPTRTASAGTGAGRPTPLRAPSEKAVTYLDTLLGMKVHNFTAERIEQAHSNVRKCSEMLDLLKLADWKPRTTEPPARTTQTATVKVPEGRYAVDGEDGALKFYRVDCPTEGRWAGYTFVKVQASDDEFPVKGNAAHAILAKIAADMDGASRRYGQEIGCCGRCGRTLTDEASRAAGIGPDCAKKGW